VIRRLDISKKGSVTKLIAALEAGHEKLAGAHSSVIVFNGKVVQLITGLPALLHSDGVLEEQDMNESCCRQTLERLRAFQEYVEWIDGRCVEVRPVTTLVRSLIDAIYGDREVTVIDENNRKREQEHKNVAEMSQQTSQKLHEIVDAMLSAAGV
jgi:hypothetical protein